MLVEIEHQDGICILRLKGRFVTGADRDYLCERTEEIKSQSCTRVLADFREVPYIDSTGIGFVVGLYTSITKNMGGRFVLVGAGPRVAEVLHLTRLNTVIPMATDMEGGLAALEPEA